MAWASDVKVESATIRVRLAAPIQPHTGTKKRISDPKNARTIRMRLSPAQVQVSLPVNQHTHTKAKLPNHAIATTAQAK